MWFNDFEPAGERYGHSREVGSVRHSTDDGGTAQAVGRLYRNGFHQLDVLADVDLAPLLAWLLTICPHLHVRAVREAKSGAVSVSEHNAYLTLVRTTGRCQVFYHVESPAISDTTWIWRGPRGLRYVHTGAVPASVAEVSCGLDGENVRRRADGALILRTLTGVVSCLDSAVFTKVPLAFAPSAAPTRSAVGALAASRPSVTLPLTVGGAGPVHARSGLNWGQRPDVGREPNQAYIPVPRTIHMRHPGFFPPRGEAFTMLTDDGDQFACVIAQAGDKAIQTPSDNSILGRYFRRRLQVGLGGLITREHLLRYGRTDVNLYKLYERTFFMDFQPPEERE